MAALYQRARPTTFAEVVGQEHVKDVLSSAIRQGRTSHAYLFSGPRGVGKTTMARLLAMAVNCEAEAALRPCGECESCRLVQLGSHPDVMELDAASHNSVEDVRDLRERVGLASLRGGKRVWILDEAHMLTKSAANALLKTLEEPPPGLVFILATTEPERLPPTILSRCQHFRFRRLTDEQIAGKLTRLSADAEVGSEPEAIGLVARAADGGMRDAESLLERLLVTGEKITLARAEETLGLPPGEQLHALATALAADDMRALLEGAARLYREGFAPRTVAEQFARHLRDLLHQRLEAGQPNAARAGEPVAPGAGEAGAVQLTSDALLLALHALDDEQERFVRNNDLYALEVALIKTRNALAGKLPAADPAGAHQASQPAAPTTEKAPASPSARAPEAPAASATSGVAATTADPERPVEPFEPNRRVTHPTTGVGEQAPGAVTQARAGAATDAAPDAAPGPRRTFSWHGIRGKASPQLKAFLMPAAASMEHNVVQLVYQDTHAFHHSQLIARQEELMVLLTKELGPDVQLIIEGPGGVRTGGGSPKA